MRLADNLAIAVMLTALVGRSIGSCDEPPTKSSSVVVQGRRLTFDPKTCTTSTGMFYWGLGSVRVTVLGHKDGQCVFDYQWEVEGAGSYVVYRVKVPTDSGPVVIEAEGREGDQEHRWSSVFTSFTKKQATLIRKAGIRWWEDLVEGTDQFVAYQTIRPGNPDKPVADGEKVTLRITVYAGDDFTKPAAGVTKARVVTFTVGKGNDWKWARVASAGMAMGEVRRVRVPVKIADGANGWLPGIRADASLFLEMAMTAVGTK